MWDLGGNGPPNNLLHRSALTGLVAGGRGIGARPVNMALGVILMSRAYILKMALILFALFAAQNPGSVAGVPTQEGARDARFTGIVLDKYLGRIPKAKVTIDGNGRQWTIVTAKDGKELGSVDLNLPMGRYTFTVEAQGFQRLVVKNLRLKAASHRTYKFRMQVLPCSDCDWPIIHIRKHSHY